MGATWRINKDRNSVEIEFPGKPSQEIRDRMKAQGFRWAGSSGVWYAKNYPYRQEFAATIADRGDDIEPTGKSFAEILEEKQDRAEARQERYEERAGKAAGEASKRFTAAHKAIEHIPPGQPILVGHHSERHHRRDLARHDTNMGKGIEAQEKAEYYASRASSAGSQLKGYDKPAFLQRRIKECEAEIRKIERQKAKWEAEAPMRARYLAWVAAGGKGEYERPWDHPDYEDGWYWLHTSNPPYTGDKLTPDYWQKRLHPYQSKLDYCRERLAELGGVKYSQADIRPGMVIADRSGKAEVIRANKTTVTVKILGIGAFPLQKIPYGDIRAILHDPAKLADQAAEQ